MLKVMIAEDNTALCTSCLEYLTKDNEIKVVSCVNDGEQALQKYLKIKPDVLLLDLNLPKMSGLEIINALSSYSEERTKCNIIVFSGNMDLLAQLYNTAKVYRVIPKPANFEYILSVVKEINAKNKEIDQKELKELLIKLKFKVFTKNSQILIEAINMAFDKPYLLNNIKNLYAEVAKLRNTHPTSIKWSIRNSIDSLNRAMTIKDFCSIFSLEYKIDAITPKTFITLIVEYFE